MLELDKEAFIRNHEQLFRSHNVNDGEVPEPLGKCRCILCDIWRKHLKETEIDSSGS